MKKLTIKPKMSNSGTIYDLASDRGDRVVKFRNPTRYAVVDASYYGGKGYTTHVTPEAAATESQRRERSHKVLDCYGNLYVASFGDLHADGVLSEDHVVEDDSAYRLDNIVSAGLE